MEHFDKPALAKVELVRELNIAAIGHLGDELAASEDGIALNLAYFDMRGWSVSDAELICEQEREYLGELAEAGWTTDKAEEIIDEYMSDVNELIGFDPGMAGAVVALSAAGATPISSCNGGTIGSSHHSSEVPHILFAASDSMDVIAIQNAIEATDLGSVANGFYGEIYADQVLKFHAFASSLIDALQRFRPQVGR
ncbi:hypothetical protein [Sinorhizobium meliloti]|uniref:hypothetical protein n=1 Tax=Rhizobium meliloti TaxID=382 RepID=UPI0020919D72|nr:hypothetical protein [Sinorhizobium meliloti]MCO5966322.1 hypothetical protein [Sinorhizobium meliloti]